MKAAEASRFHPAPDGAATQSRVEKLAARDHPVLALG
jgi:hypothetical protein